MFKQKLKNRVIAKRLSVLVLPVLFVVISATAAYMQPKQALAATSNTVNFQARLLTAAGNVVPDGYYNIEFKIYKAESSSGSAQGSCTGDTSNCLWTETRIDANKVRVSNGYLTVNLGSVTAFPGTMPWDQQLWLTMNIGGTGSPSWDGEMNPRLKLTATPYAMATGKIVSSDGTGSATVANGESGTICIQNTSTCGFVQSQSSVLQTAETNLKIQGTTAGQSALAVQAASGQTANIFEVQNAAGDALFIVGTARTTSNLNLTVSGSGSAADTSLIVKGNDNMGDYDTIIDVQKHDGDSIFRVTAQGVGIGNMTGDVGMLGIANGQYFAEIQSTLLTSTLQYQLPNEAGTFCLQGKLSCGFVMPNTTDFIRNQQLVMQQAGFWVQATDASKVGYIFQAPPSSGSDIMQIQNGDNTARVAFTSNAALAFTGNGSTSMITPVGSSVSTKIKIDVYDPGSYGQILAFGLAADAQNTARGISIFDARTGEHQPTITVFSPNENDVFGLSWEGSNTNAYLKSSNSQITIRTGSNVDTATFGSTGVALGRNTTITAHAADSNALTVQGAASGTAPVAVIKGGATPGTLADLLQVQNSAGNALFSVNRDGLATAARGFNMTYNAGSTFAIQGSSSAFVSVDPQNSKFYIGDEATCGGRFCVSQAVSTGGSAYTNSYNYLKGNAAIVASSNFINQDIVVEDDTSVSSGTRNNNRGIRIDFTASGNAYSNYYGLQVKIPSTTSATSYGGNAIQIDNGSTGIFSVSNLGNVTVQTTSNSANTLQVADSSGNNVFAVDTTNKQIVVGKASASAGKVVLQNASNANTVTLQSGVVTASYTLTLPTALGATGDCLTDSGAGALAFSKCSLQTAYGSAVGGTTPEIKLDSTRGGFDIQDANTTIGESLFNVRGSNASGLGAAYLTVDNTGNIGIGNAAPSRTLDIAVNSSATTTPPVRLMQSGTGDASIELGTSSRSFTMGVDNSDGSRFKIASSTGQGTSFNLGLSTIGSSGPNDQNNNDMIISSRVTTSSAGSANSISIYVAQVDPDTGFGLGSVALYSHTGGNPGAPYQLITSTGSQALHTGWNVFAINASLSATTTYWISFIINGNQTGIAYQNSTGHTFFTDNPFSSSWPADLSAMTSSDFAMSYSLYMSGSTIPGTSDTFNTSLMSIGDSGTTFRSVTDSGDAFKIVNSTEQTLFLVDTLQNNVSVFSSSFTVASATTNITGTLNLDGASIYMNNITQGSGGSGIRSLCIANSGKRVYFGAASTTCYASSARYKHDITSMSESKGLETILGLRPVTFVYNDGDGSTQVGLIAEEVEQILPEVVSYDDQGLPVGVNYENMIANLIKAIQQQQLQIGVLQQGIWNGGLVSGDATFNGYVAFNGGVKFMNDTEFNGKAIFKGSVSFNENTSGSMVVPAGQTEAIVQFTQQYAHAPNISVSSSDFVAMKVQDKTVDGFKIVIPQVLDHDIAIDWIALQANSPPVQSP